MSRLKPNSGKAFLTRFLFSLQTVFLLEGNRGTIRKSLGSEPPIGPIIKSLGTSFESVFLLNTFVFLSLA